MGARGARCVVANSRAVDIEELAAEELEFAGPEVAARMSSMSWRRRREKWRDVSVSRSCTRDAVSCVVCHRLCADHFLGTFVLGHTED